MIAEFILVIVMHFTVGNAREPYAFVGEKPYKTLEACNEEGKKAAEWLTQDFVSVGWMCVKRKDSDL